MTGDNNNQQYYCVAYVPDAEPPKDCNGRSNPIHPSTGQKFQLEADYAGPTGGLNFLRTYRSNNGRFTSVLNSLWLDDSVAGAQAGGCYQGVAQSFNHCFPYVATGSQNYRLYTAEGRSIGFSGPPSAVTAKANVNVRVAQHTNALGATEWLIYREDNSTEIYNTRGQLVRKVEVDGKSDIAYAYSDTGTPSAIAPRPDLLIHMTEQSGRQLNFTFDSTGRVATMTDPAGGLYQYGYDVTGNQSSITYPDSLVRTYHYAEAANIDNGAACDGSPSWLPTALTGITDENAIRYATFKYNCSGQAVSSEHAGGLDKSSFSYAVTGVSDPLLYPNPSTAETDPLGTVRTHTFTRLLSVDRPTGISEPGGSGCGASSSAITYDTNGNVASRTDFDQHKICYQNDANRNLETKRIEGLLPSADCTSSLGTSPAPTAANPVRTITTSWHPDWRLESRRAEPKKITTWVYNGQADPTSGGGAASCAPSSALLPDGKPIAALCKKVEQATTDTTGTSGFSATVTGSPRTWSWTYNTFGQVLTANGPRTDVTDVTTYTYYPDTAADHTLGDLHTVKDALGHITTYTSYDKNGRALTIVDPNSLTTTLTYFPRGWLKTRQIGSELTTYDYDAVGQLKKVTAPDLSWIGYDYDPAHRLTDIYDNLGNRITYTLDNAGNRTREEVKDPGGTLARTQTRVYDALSRLQNIIQSE